MTNTELWLMPLILLPGIALLILSTSTRYSRIHDEIHHLLISSDCNQNNSGKILIKRAVLFRDSLILLYFCVVVFAVTAFFGGIMSALNVQNNIILMLLFLIGIINLIIASVFLIKEAFLSLEIIRKHEGEFKE